MDGSEAQAIANCSISSGVNRVVLYSGKLQRVQSVHIDNSLFLSFVDAHIHGITYTAFISYMLNFSQFKYDNCKVEPLENFLLHSTSELPYNKSMRDSCM